MEELQEVPVSVWQEAVERYKEMYGKDAPAVTPQIEYVSIPAEHAKALLADEGAVGLRALLGADESGKLIAYAQSVDTAGNVIRTLNDEIHPCPPCCPECP